MKRTALVPFFWLFLAVPAVLAQTVPETIPAETSAQAPVGETTPPTPETPEPTPENPSQNPENSPETIPEVPEMVPPAATVTTTPQSTPNEVPETSPEEVVSPETPPVESESLAEETPSTEEAPVEEITTTEETAAEEPVDYSGDYQLYKKYLLYEKYQKRDLYQKYKRYVALAGKYPWENPKQEKKVLKKLKKEAKKYYKKPHKYPGLAGRASDYSTYGTLKSEYFSLKPFAGYADYARFDRDEYAGYQSYGAPEIKAGYDRYAAALAAGLVTDRGDADLESGNLGPEITVGIFNYTPRDLKEDALSLKADKSFQIIDRDGAILAVVPAETKIKIRYDGDKKFKVYYSGSDILIGKPYKEVRFVGVPEEKENIIFDVSRPNSSFDHYRGSLRLRYYDSPETDGDRVWVINALPLEHYVWGMGEITGTGPEEYNRVMTTIFRTYGYWKIKWSTKYADQGFKVDATPGNQLYYGHDWEKTHPTIRAAAEATRGTLVMYDREIALTPYSSWTDGATRRFEDGHWGRNCVTEKSKTSSLYPWLSAASDARGRNESKNTCELAAGGNHMVGLSANGAVRMAKYDGAGYEGILEHFYSGVDLVRGY